MTWGIFFCVLENVCVMRRRKDAPSMVRPTHSSKYIEREKKFLHRQSNERYQRGVRFNTESRHTKRKKKRKQGALVGDAVSKQTRLLLLLLLKGSSTRKERKNIQCAPWSSHSRPFLCRPAITGSQRPPCAVATAAADFQASKQTGRQAHPSDKITPFFQTSSRHHSL
jgi:hypothetical protein